MVAAAAHLSIPALLCAFNGLVRLERHPVSAHELFSMKCRSVPYRRSRGRVVDEEDGGGVASVLVVRWAALRSPVM